jgi:dihydrofolate reductase
LIKHDLIDELHFFVNPAAISAGMTIFREPGRAIPLKLAGSEAYHCGIVVNSYTRK